MVSNYSNFENGYPSVLVDSSNCTSIPLAVGLEPTTHVYRCPLVLNCHAWIQTKSARVCLVTRVAVSFLTRGQSRCHQPPPHPKPLVVCVHYKWLRITLPMCWTSHRPLLSRLSHIFPRDFITLQMSTAVSEQCGNNALYLCKCIYMYIQFNILIKDLRPI
jgi:hypothetical protein